MNYKKLCTLCKERQPLYNLCLQLITIIKIQTLTVCPKWCLTLTICLHFILKLIAFCMQELVCSVAALHNGVFSYRKLKITAALSSVTARFSPKLFSSWILDSSSVSWLDMLRGDTGGTPLPPARHSLYCSVGRKQVSGLVRLYMGNR